MSYISLSLVGPIYPMNTPHTFRLHHLGYPGSSRRSQWTVGSHSSPYLAPLQIETMHQSCSWATSSYQESDRSIFVEVISEYHMHTLGYSPPRLSRWKRIKTHLYRVSREQSTVMTEHLPCSVESRSPGSK